MPRTLDCLRNEDKYILDIIESLATSLGLLTFLFFMEKKGANGAEILYTSKFVEECNATYFLKME